MRFLIASVEIGEEKSSVIACSVCLQKYCLEDRIQLENDSLRDNGGIDVMPSTRISAHFVNKGEVPADRFHLQCCYQKSRNVKPATPKKGELNLNLQGRRDDQSICTKWNE